MRSKSRNYTTVFDYFFRKKTLHHKHINFKEFQSKSKKYHYIIDMFINIRYTCKRLKNSQNTVLLGHNAPNVERPHYIIAVYSLILYYIRWKLARIWQSWTYLILYINSHGKLQLLLYFPMDTFMNCNCDQMTFHPVIWREDEHHVEEQNSYLILPKWL